VEKIVSVVKSVSVVVVNNDMVGRPKILRKTCCVPECTCFKPSGGEKRLSVTVLMPDEIDALNFCDKQKLKQSEAAKKMKVSQPTLARILASARQKLATAIINGEEITFSS
jgi:predicted DNA-binding protein (UPF0251 family)